MGARDEYEVAWLVGSEPGMIEILTSSHDVTAEQIAISELSLSALEG